LGAENPLALDVVVGEIMGLPRDSNPLLLEAEKQGRGPTRMEEINLVGLDPAELRVEDFQLPSSVSPETGLRRVSWLQRTFLPLVKGGLTLQPRVIAKDCIACEECLLICPEGVISLRGEEHVHAWIDDQGCIRCYCCHETCPENAIELHKSLLYKLIIG
jgi:ferredoxin